MTKKKHIIIFIDWFLPAYKAGGQIPSVFNIIQLLSKEINFSVITSNSDEGEAPFKNIKFNTWTENFGVRILYVSPENQNLNFYKEILKNEIFEAIYLNSFFSFRFTSLPMIATRKINKQAKIILAPRGMLGQGALKIKASKKRVFIFLAKIFNFYKNVHWHASSELEAQEIKHIFGSKTQNIKTAIDISFLPKAEKINKEKKENELKLFFISRITDKKNLKGALTILAKITQGSITFDIIGPIDNQKYWEECQNIIKTLPQNIKTNYLGAIPNYELIEKLKEYHFFLFPSFSENYGHVIAESLAAGCPVILSDQTPWQDLDENKAGWVVALNNYDRFGTIIDKCLKMNKSEYNKMANKSIKYLQKKINAENIFENNRAIFL